MEHLGTAKIVQPTSPALPPAIISGHAQTLYELAFSRIGFLGWEKVSFLSTFAPEDLE